MNNESGLGKSLIVVALLVGLAGGYVYGNSAGYKAGNTAGYKQAQDDAKKVADEAAKKATEAVAKAANPFQAVNPLEGVESNPFEKTKNILNPFQ
ncbi:MAG: hypothetical protein AAB965_02120 [Patescibacteria group bacterium]